MIFIGDIHGNFRTFLKTLEESSYKNTHMIQVGDFGVGFRPLDNDKEYLNSINEHLVERNNTLYVFRGNHDNPDYYENCPFDYSNIKFLKDFSVINVENKNILIVGGAISIDRVHRKAGISYWKGEELPYIIPDIKDIVDDDIKIDVVCTHNCPSFVWPTELNHIVKSFIALDPRLEQELINERKRLDLLYSKVIEHNGYAPKLWVYGHMHKTILTKYEESNFQCCGIDYFYEHDLQSL
jgi:UDP-2,3-diacylglucosamine pyrophosphatase LpxH